MVTYKNFARALTPFARQIPLWVTVFLVAAAAVNLIGNALGRLPVWAVSLLDVLSDFSAVFLGIFIEAAPFLLLGTLASGLVEVFIDRSELARWMPRGTFLGALAGGLVGLFFPVCECGVVPFTRRLMRKGAPVPVGIAALLAAPVVNPIVIASTLAAFGVGPIFWGRMALTLAIAVTVGFVFGRVEPSMLLRETDISETKLAVSVEPPTQAVPLPLRARMSRALVIAVDEFFEMGRFLILGALLAALMQTFVRQSALLEVGQGPVLSVLVMILLAALLSVCSTVDAFIALAFSGVFTGGAVLAFLVFGPMVDIKSTLMFLRVFRPRVVVYLILLPLMLTLVAAVAINLLAPGLMGVTP